MAINPRRWNSGAARVQMLTPFEVRRGEKLPKILRDPDPLVYGNIRTITAKAYLGEGYAENASERSAKEYCAGDYNRQQEEMAELRRKGKYPGFNNEGGIGFTVSPVIITLPGTYMAMLMVPVPQRMGEIWTKIHQNWCGVVELLPEPLWKVDPSRLYSLYDTVRKKPEPP